MVPPGCVLSCAAEAARPDEAWVGDISSIRTRQGFLYLAFVLDLAFRRVVGISMVPHLKTSLATYALREAIATRGDHVHGVVFHTDRGSQYTSDATAQLCRAYGIRQSVGRTGVCWDNAGAESFLGTLKKELVNRADYQSVGGSKPGTTPAGFTPPSGNSHQTNGRTTTTITRPHKPSVQLTGGTPDRTTTTTTPGRLPTITPRPLFFSPASKHHNTTTA